MGQSVSINLLLIAPFISLLGGGGTVLVSTMYAIVSDVAEESERYEPQCENEYMDANV